MTRCVMSIIIVCDTFREFIDLLPRYPGCDTFNPGHDGFWGYLVRL